MRYLKKINEYLKSSTYRSASDRLTKMGHKRRGAELSDYANEIEMQENKVLLDSQEDSKDFGLFDLTIKRGFGSNQIEIFSGKFYLQMCLESDWFRDQLCDWLSDDMNGSIGIAMEFAIIPADVETFKIIEESEDKYIVYFRNNSSWGDYKYWTNRLWITLFDKNAEPAFRCGVAGFESRDNYTFYFNSRRDTMKFKKLLYETLAGESNWSSWRDKPISEQLKSVILLDEEDWRKLLMDHYLKYKDDADELIIGKGIKVDDPDTWPKNPFTEDIYKGVVDSVKRMSVNSLYID